MTTTLSKARTNCDAEATYCAVKQRLRPTKHQLFGDVPDNENEESFPVVTPVREATTNEHLLCAMDKIITLNRQILAAITKNNMETLKRITGVNMEAQNRLAEAAGKSQAMLGKLVDKLCED